MSYQSSRSVLAEMNNVNNHNSSYAGSNNDENVHNTSRTLPVELKLFMMHFVGKGPARTLVRSHCIELKKGSILSWKGGSIIRCTQTSSKANSYHERGCRLCQGAEESISIRDNQNWQHE